MAGGDSHPSGQIEKYIIKSVLYKAINGESEK